MENWAVLSGRLRDLEARGVIERHVMPTSPPSVEYQLTSLGWELLPAIMSLWKSDHGCCSVTLWANGEAATTEANRFISVRHSRRSARLGGYAH